jgi:hypothetical protein
MHEYEKVFTSTFRLLGILWLVSIMISACQPGHESRNHMPIRDIKAVMEAHVEDLMAIPGVVGVAIGELDNGTPCIKVMVIELTDELDRKIPKTLEGHPVLVVESGEFKPM